MGKVTAPGQLIDEIKRIRKGLPENFCPVPFTTIILEPDGKVGLCRNKGHDFPMGQLTFQSIDELWDIRNSEKAMQWRREFLEGNIQICREEVSARKCNLDFPMNELLPHAELAVKQTSRILRLTANFNGHCNMQCPFCEIWQLPNGNYKEENFWIPAREQLFPFLKQIDMLSGEPFIQADTFKLIDEVSAVNGECEWLFTTNLFWNLTPAIEAKLEKINIRSIACSIDSLNGEVYAKLRPPGKLKITLKNLDNMLDFRQRRAISGRPFVMSFNFLAQKENWKELPEIIRFAARNQMELYLILLRLPSVMSLLDFDEPKRREILDYYLREIPREDLFRANAITAPLAQSLGKLDVLAYLSYLKPPKDDR